jgi:hypothetical protein
MARLVTPELHCALFLGRLRHGALPLGEVHVMRIGVSGRPPGPLTLEIRTEVRDDLDAPSRSRPA